MGASGVFLYYLAYNVALVHTSATQAAIIQSFIPIVTALLAFFFLREALSTVRVTGIAVSIGGIFLILAAGEAGAGAPNPLAGNLLVLASVVIWSAYTIFRQTSGASGSNGRNRRRDSVRHDSARARRAL